MSKTGINRADVSWNPCAQLAAPLKRKKPATYVVNSMSDLFYGFTDVQIAAVFGVIAATPRHTFFLTTKWAKRMQEWFDFVGDSYVFTSFHDGREQTTAEGCRDEAFKALGLPQEPHMQPMWSRGLLGYDMRWPLPNAILGVSVENQATANERIPHLLATPAAVRAISAEPLLGPIDIPWPGIDWVIVGCESGSIARACEVDWLRSLRDQCTKAKVPFWLKQARVDCGCPWSHAHNDTEGCESCSCTWSPGDVGSVESGVVARTDSQIKYDPSNNRLGALVSLPYLDGVQWVQRPYETATVICDKHNTRKRRR